MEHCTFSEPPPFPCNISFWKSQVLCRTASVKFLADPATDEVFVKIVLVPVDSFRSGIQADVSETRDGDDDKIVAFAKVLTPSDANNGGGFSVPRFCADSIFPPLNFHVDPPVQMLRFLDVHGIAWEFRHIYRGTPRRHLLTTGWSKYVNHKKLISGDSVVFMRNFREGLFVGVRRASNVKNSRDCVKWKEQIGVQNREVNLKLEDRFSSWRGRLSPDMVVEAAERAAQGLAFEVVYYPKTGCSSEFVVRADVVDSATTIRWNVGMRVKMAMETEDSSRMTWFQGTITNVLDSLWHMLRVRWDEPEILRNASQVNPWQVEFVSPPVPVRSIFPPTKKLKPPDDSAHFTEQDGGLFPVTSVTSPRVGILNPYSNFSPIGIQGARQDILYLFGLTDLKEKASKVYLDTGSIMTPLGLQALSAELNHGSSKSDNLSPDSQSSICSFISSETLGVKRCGSEKAGLTSFQLFGKVIHLNQSSKSSFDEVGCNEFYEINDTENDNSLLDLTLSSSYTDLLNGMDECRSVPAVEACL